MNNEYLISYIIPSYNAESYIERCVNSISESDSDYSYEIIIIENGSTDRTTEIIKTLANRNNHIKIYHSEKGVSKARNVGIEKSQGKWIFFADSDDYIISGTIKTIEHCAKNYKNDLYIFGHQSGDRIVHKCSDKYESYNKNQLEAQIVKMLKNPTIYLTVWGKLFKRELIINNNLSFDPELSFAEDSHFTLQYLKCVENICLCHDIVYMYSIDTPSVMRGNASNKMNAYIKALQKSETIFTNDSASLRHAFSYYVIMHLYIVMVRTIFSVHNRQSLSDKMDNLKHYCRKGIIMSSINDIHLTECFSIKMLPCMFIKLKLFILAALIFRIRAVQNYKKETHSYNKNGGKYEN